MSTHAHIGVMLPNGKIGSVYVHHDGYPSVAGKQLHGSYRNEKIAVALVEANLTNGIDHFISGGGVIGLAEADPEGPYLFDNWGSFKFHARNNGSYTYWWQDGAWRCTGPDGSGITLPSKIDH